MLLMAFETKALNKNADITAFMFKKISILTNTEWTDKYNFKNYRDRIDSLCLISKDIIDEIRSMVE